MREDPSNSNRNKSQKSAAEKLTDEEITVGVLSGPAGCGKTKIALEWAANNNAKKIIWVCPRVQICQGLVNDLTSKEYLPNTKIEICTDEFKTLYQNGSETPTPENQEFSGDIVLTTIDQIINTITTHKKVTGLVQFMNAHIVFDEYHEYIPMTGFNLLFAELVECKKLQRENKTLLVSATPNFHFIKELLGLYEDDIISIESYNQNQYQIKFQKFDEKLIDETNPLCQLQDKNKKTFVISNTAINAQLSFIHNQKKEKAILIHSKFKPSDKRKLFNKVFGSFKQNGSKSYDVLRAGPIVQASLNITCDKMISEFTNAENWLQRIGRLDRFGKNTKPNIYISAVSEHVRKGKCLGNAKFLNSLFCLQSTKAWLEFLEKSLPENKIVTITKMYQIYQKFYKDPSSIKAIEQDLLRALKKSVLWIDKKDIDPTCFPNKKQPKDNQVKIKNNSLRGNNRFVQMAVMNINNNKEEFPNEYACREESLTLSVESIMGYGEDKKNLLAFMEKKHHNIKNDTEYGVKSTTRYKDKIYLKKSKEQDTPIYLSYTLEDLAKVDARQNPYAMYYAIGTKQPIGVISNDKLKGE